MDMEAFNIYQVKSGLITYGLIVMSSENPKTLEKIELTDEQLKELDVLIEVAIDEYINAKLEII